MKKVFLVVAVVVAMVVAFGIYVRVYGSPFWSQEDKVYNVAKLLSKKLAKFPDGIKFADHATQEVYDNQYAKWRVGVNMTAKNGLGVLQNIFLVVEFSANNPHPNFNNADDWTMDGYSDGEEYYGSMERFKEKEPTVDDISIDKFDERVSEYGGSRTVYASITNHANKAARIVEVEVKYTDANGELVETGNGYVYGIAPGRSELAKCLVIGSVHGAKKYHVSVKEASFER